MEVFSYLSLACIVKRKLFCVHGGIPRVFRANPEVDIIKVLRKVQKPILGDDAPRDKYDKILFDITWSDPANPSLPTDPSLPPGFRINTRDPKGSVSACTFETEVLHEFLDRYKFSMLSRAHECMQNGCYVQNSCRMITVFSSSGYYKENSAGVLLLHKNKILILRMNSAPTSGIPLSYPL